MFICIMSINVRFKVSHNLHKLKPNKTSILVCLFGSMCRPNRPLQPSEPHIVSNQTRIRTHIKGFHIHRKARIVLYVLSLSYVGKPKHNVRRRKKHSPNNSQSPSAHTHIDIHCGFVQCLCVCVYIYI